MRRADDPMKRPCPLCGAKRGQLCRTPAGNSTWFLKPHRAREAGRISASDWNIYQAHRAAGNVR